MTIPPKVRRILTWVGYPVAYLVLFATFAYCTFPYDRLKHRLETGFNAAQQNQSRGLASADRRRDVVVAISWGSLRRHRLDSAFGEGFGGG